MSELFSRCRWRGWVMNRRTPRRRISPRTVRRCRAIKNFVRRALGSSSQPDIKFESSISASVLDLKQKINGIEQQLSTVSKHCNDLVTIESKLKLKDNFDFEDTDADRKKIKVTEREVLQNKSQVGCNKNHNKRSIPKCNIGHDEAGIGTAASNKMLDQKSRKGKLSQVQNPIGENEQIIRSSYGINESRNCTRENLSHSEMRHRRNRKKTKYFEPVDELLNNHAEQPCGDHRYHHGHEFHSRPNLDQDFIADIIRRQYMPVKLLGKRESDFSQISAPVCRDQEFPIRETIEEGSDLCSCCHNKHRRHRQINHMCNHDLNDIRSICDTRLYSSKNHKHNASRRKQAHDYYNDSTMYDVIPVKEKCSPKSRRKFVEDNMIHDNYREVLPSPRTQRPRLNLQARLQTEDDDDDINLKKQFKQTKILQHKSATQNDENLSKISSEVFIHNRNLKCTSNLPYLNDTKPYIEECVGTSCKLQYPETMNEQPVINNDITLKAQSTHVSADKALNEIKDILQSFLEEIKKEAPQLETQTNTNEIQTQVKNNVGHCGLSPFAHSFPSSCCYPLLPVCPITCMPNGFTPPSPSFSCAGVNNSKEEACESNIFKIKTNNSDHVSNETQRLIKEIHNLISQNPKSVTKTEFCNNTKTRTFVSNSPCGSSTISKHDAEVDTRILTRQSKSCEAIGLREAGDLLYATNGRYSDRVLEKGSGEEISTESEYSIDPIVVDKKKGNKFKNILRAMGILKRKNHELSQTYSSTYVVGPKPGSKLKSPPVSPYPHRQQQIINYNVHGHEYFHPPVHQYQHEGECCAQQHSGACCSLTNIDKKIKHSQRKHYLEQDMLTHRTSPIHSPIAMCANYYNPQCGSVSSQVPVCLKEIEVKNIGTQSVRKLSLLEKLTNKIQVPVQQAKNSSKLSSAGKKDESWKGKQKPSLFDWKRIHEKTISKTNDPLKFSYKTQKRLDESDNTMRNAMLKKLLYKRNPFSPRNLMVRTLLGKNKSSFGQPPKLYKPKMFL